MSDIDTARTVLSNALDYFTYLVKKANNLTSSSHMPCILPDLEIEKLTDYQAKLKPGTSSSFSDQDFLDLVKNDFGNVHADHGHIEFKAFTKLATVPKDYDPTKEDSRKYKPVKVFEYPRKNDTSSFADFGAALHMDLAAFSMDYDFRPSDHYLITLKDIKLALELQSPDTNDLDATNKPKLKPVFTTPPFPVTVEIKIPKPLSATVEFPNITLSFFGFRIDLDVNFPSFDFNWSPLKLAFPDWLNWPFGPLDFNLLFGSSWTCDCFAGFVGPDWFKLRGAGIDIQFFKLAIKRLAGFFDFPNWNGSSISYFTHNQPAADSSFVPEFAAIYFNLSGLSEKILGGFAPKQLHLMLGVHKNGQVKAGFLTCTRELGILDSKSLMFQADAHYDFDAKTEPEFKIEGHPGFAIEVLSGAKYSTLATKAGCSSPPPPAEISFDGFSAKAERLAIEWDKDANDYVVFVDGAVTIKKFVKDVQTSADLTLPFKGLGVTMDGRLVLKDSWNTLDKALQVKLDDIEQVVLFLRSYGYGKKASGDFWVGFSGDLGLPVIDLKAGVDKLVIRSDGGFDLSGVKIDMDFKKVLSLKGALQWGNNLASVPAVPGTTAKGFGGQLNLGIPDIPLNLGLGMTYVKVKPPSDEFVAWSFFVEAPLPVVIPVCFCLGINSVGMLVGQNYIPLPKKKGLPTDKWLEEGFNGDVDNILDVVNSWAVERDNFAAGFSVGIATTADNGFIVNGKAILVLVVPGPIIMIAGKANILSRANPNKSGAFDLLIVYDHADPGILTSLAFRYDVKYLASVKGMAELYFSFTDVGDWHFYLGTPAKPVAASVFHIFEAQGYLTIDSDKLAVGAMVFYGKKWSFGPLSVKSYISFSAALTISWNPAFIEAMIKLVGEIGAKIFGFGLEAALEADLRVKVPDPWYLSAAAEARFSISLLFFSWSFTVHLEFSWGTDDTNPEVQLEALYAEEGHLALSANSTRSHASLLPEASEALPVRYLPMDGVLGLKFLRDIELDSASVDFLDAFTPVGIRDEPSPYASNFTKFHGRLTNFKVQKLAADGALSPVSPIYFTWTPEDSGQRKKLIVREFDRGYSQFRLNDDPNAHVQLTCPDFYLADSPLLFDIDQHDYEESTGRFAVDNPLILSCRPPQAIDVRLSKSSTSSPSSTDYSMGYPDFTAGLLFDPVVLIEKKQYSSVVAPAGFEIELTKPSAAVIFSFVPDQPTAASPSVGDFFDLFDETGNDMTQTCICHLVPTASGFTVLLNDFDTLSATSAKKFSTQTPPTRGIKQIKWKASGTLVPKLWDESTPYLLALYPLEALEEIHGRNLALLEQRAKLKYVFGQNDDPGKLLWDVGAHRVEGKTIYETSAGDEAPPSGGANPPASFSHDFTIIKPFEKKEITVGGETTQVQPFTDYLRRLVPAAGHRPFYRDQYPVSAYNCNYVNAMLQKAGQRLVMVMTDSNGDPSTYLRAVPRLVTFDVVLGEEVREMAKGTSLHVLRDEADLRERIGQLVDGLELADVESAYGRGWKRLLRKAATDAEPPMTARVLERNELLGRASELVRRRRAEPNAESTKRAVRLAKTLGSKFPRETDRALVFELADKVVLLSLHFEKKVVEYRYTNDDLALDLSSLQLSECLAQDQPVKLNAYERGYFKPIVPVGAFWGGLRRNTAYTARVFCLDENDDLDANLSGLAELHSSPFTTSSFSDVEGLANLFDKCKVRDLTASQSIYDSVIDKLDGGFSQKAFPHPDASSVDVHLGLEVFRELSASPQINANGKTPKELEETHQELYDKSQDAIKTRLTEETLVLEEIFEEIGIGLDATSPKRIFATWLRTMEGQSGDLGTIGLLLEFPEPIDWSRTGISIGKLEALLDGTEKKDLLDLKPGDPSYEVKLHWLRSRCGTKLLLIPELFKTVIYNPRVVLPEGRLRVPEGFASAAAGAEIAPRETGLSSGEPESRDAAVSGGVAVSDGDGVLELTEPTAGVFERHRLGDLTVPSSMGVRDPATLKSLRRKYGEKTTTRVTNYEVQALDLKFFYLSENSENKNSNFRAIPRLRFRKGKPGDANGWIGTLSPLPKKAN